MEGVLIYSGAVAFIFIAIVAITLRGYFLDVQNDLKSVLGKVGAIVESQRLSTILRIEPASLKVDPAKFELNRERLKTRLLQELGDPRNPKDRDPATAAYCILNHSGLEDFVDYDTSKGIKSALARLITNGEMDEARRFLQEVVDKL